MTIDHDSLCDSISALVYQCHGDKLQPPPDDWKAGAYYWDDYVAVVVMLIPEQNIVRYLINWMCDDDEDGYAAIYANYRWAGDEPDTADVWSAFKYTITGGALVWSNPARYQTILNVIAGL